MKDRVVRIHNTPYCCASLNHVHAMIELLGSEDIVYGLIWESFLAV